MKVWVVFEWEADGEWKIRAIFATALVAQAFASECTRVNTNRFIFYDVDPYELFETTREAYELV